MKKDATLIKTGRLAGLWANLPGYDLLDRFVDAFAARQRVRVIVASDGYCELRVLWGLIEFAKGSKQEFLIEGGPGFCEAALRSLEGSQRTVKVVSRIMGNRKLLD
jgi:hypothetical protein